MHGVQDTAQPAGRYRGVHGSKRSCGHACHRVSRMPLPPPLHRLSIWLPSLCSPHEEGPGHLLQRQQHRVAYPVHQPLQQSRGARGSTHGHQEVHGTKGGDHELSTTCPATVSDSAVNRRAAGQQAGTCVSSPGYLLSMALKDS